ncbi:hypothetical protein [Tropicimonas sediminicola]|nr:hypothetical protein [Tropicimonas sediminicola]
MAFPVVAILSLAACEPQVPDSGAGVGFGSYSEYQYQMAQERAARNAQLSGTTTVRAPEATGAPSPTAVPSTGVTSADLAAAGIGSAQAAPGSTAITPAPAGSAVITPAPGAPLAATAAGAAYVGGSNPGISDEQDFSAVAARESIQSDADRIAQQRAQREVVAPAAVPSRPGDTGPDIVAYALQTTNPVGRQAYMRTLPSQSKATRNCAKYPSPDVAQRAFLAAGGPERDRYGIDPDGDGFACGWNPEPFRRAVGR